MFGELIGFFAVNVWQQMGQPKSFTLLELGPGRGTLMQDALRAADADIQDQSDALASTPGSAPDDER